MKKLWKKSLSLKENLHRRMPKLAAEYFAAGRTAMAPGTSWHDMHQFRLATKRFRYTLEIFRSAYGPGMDRRIEALKKVQTFLGDINDYIVTDGILEGLDGTEETRHWLAEKADKKTHKLRTFWLREFDAAGEEMKWQRYLSTYACRKRPLPRTRRISAPPAEATVGSEAVATDQG